MEKKSLYIYKINEQGEKVKFPNSDMPAKLGEYTYSAQRMAGTPTITATLNYPSCLDDSWSGEEFVEFRGEKYYVDQIPTSSKDNKSIMYKHELQLVSERIVLENVYFMDVVTAGSDTYHSNSTSVKFMGDINEFVGRLNASMTKSGIGYSVVIDDDITSDSKLVSLDNVYIADALQSIYTIYDLPYYFVGKVCHIGYTENVISTPFEYRKGLVSIKKTNANYKTVNRVTGVGSSDNIPFYYPNDDETGTIERSQNLMPSIYRQTSGAERFYNALNNTYKIPGTNDYYLFKNTYSSKNVKEIKVDFSDIKPTIEGVTNTSGKLFGEIADIAFDANDSDDLGTGTGNNVFNGTDEYVHSYFYIKLHIYNGDYGFNLFEQGLEGGTAVINMTTGNCAACEFEIGVTYKDGEKRAYNPVLVGPTGNLIPGDFEQKVTSDTSQYVDIQQDTSINSVWIAVKKDNTSFGVVMPNATNNYRPSVGDKFVITGIKMPKSLVLAAEKRLEEALIKYMSENNDEKFMFSVNFSRVFLAENTYLWDILNENARIYIKYNNREYLMYVNSYTCKADKNCLYDISVELEDKLSANVSSLRSTITEIAGDIIGGSIGGGGVSNADIISKVSRYFLSKTHDDRTTSKVSSDKAFEVGKFVSGSSGAIVYKDVETGHTIGELDKLRVRLKAYFETLEIINVNSVGGKQIITPGGSIRVNKVEETDNSYKCYFLSEQDGEKVENRFVVGDQAYCQIFNAKTGVSNNVSNTYYWRLVTGVGEDYIELSKYDCDTGSDIPAVGDVINQRGNRNDVDRQNALEFSSVDTFSPSITLYQGINNYSLSGKDVVSYGVDKTTGKSFMNVYGEMYVGDRNENTFVKYTQTDGVEIKGKLSIGTKIGNGKTIEEALDDATRDAIVFADKDIENLSSYVNELFSTILEMKDFTTNAFSDGIVDNSESSVIYNYLNSIGIKSGYIDNAYNEVYNNELLDGVTKTNLNNAYNSFKNSINELTLSIEEAIEDGTITSNERAYVDGKYTAFDTKYRDFIAYMYEANRYIQHKTNAAANEALEQLGGLAYLKKALKEDTTIEGGLIQSSVLALGYTNEGGVYKVMSGTNGIYDSSKLGGGIASWWGGSMKDRWNYIDENVPSDVAKALVRMDGSGYLANGSIWWGTDGVVHADPLSFFVGEETVGGLLASFQVVFLEGTNKPDYLIPKVPFQSLTVANEIKLGGGNLKWDNSRKSYYVSSENGENVGFYATGDIIAYGQNSGQDINSIIPIAGTTTTGLVRIKPDGGILVQSDGSIYVDPSFEGGGVSFTTGTALELTTSNVLNVKLGTSSGTACAGNDSRLHTHSNKSVLDGISSTLINNWNAAYNSKDSARPNPYALSWSGYNSGSYDGSSAKSFTIPSNTNQLTNGAGFIKDTNGTFTALTGSGSSSKYLAGNGTFYTIGYNELSGTPDLSVYVTLGTTQTISGSKTYTNTGWYNGTGLLKAGPSNNVHIIFGSGSGNVINGVTSSEAIGNLYFNYGSGSKFTRVDSSNNIITTGDIVAYSTGGSLSSYAPVADSSTYGLVKFDNSTIKKNSNGQLYCTVSGGGTSGVTSVTVSGTGNAVTSASISGSTLTLTKGTTFLKSITASGTGNVVSSVSNSSGSVTLNKGVTALTPSDTYWSGINMLYVNGTSKYLSLANHTHPEYLTSHQSIYALTLSINGTSKTYDPKTSSGNSLSFTVSGSSTGGWKSGTYTDNAICRVNNTGNGGLVFWNSSNSTGCKLGGGNGLIGYSSSYGTLGNLYLNYKTSTVNVQINNAGKITYVSAGTWSDIRLKDKVESLSGVLDKLQRIDVFRFRWKDRRDNLLHIGVSAQEVQALFPELVEENFTGDYYLNDGSTISYLTVDYQTLNTIAFQGVKELYARFRPVETEVERLKKRVSNLQRRLDNAYQEIFKLKGGEAA